MYTTTTNHEDDEQQQQQYSDYRPLADDEEVNEEAPLLGQRDRTAPPDPQLSNSRLSVLTCVNGGLQVFFSTIMANLPVHIYDKYSSVTKLALIGRTAIPPSPGTLQSRNGYYNRIATAFRSLGGPIRGSTQ